MSNYSAALANFKTKILDYVEQIFKYSSNELVLRLEQLNLLNNEANCLESSTAFGFIIEEFLVSKLDEYTIRHDGGKDYRIQRTGQSVSETSYDCVSEIHNGIRALINVKVCKSGGENNAVAAIQQLYKDYVETEPQTPKCFLVLKVHYGFCRSIRRASKNERAISIKGIEAYYLDQIDLSNEHLQDHRSWSGKAKNANAGRLQISKTFFDAHQVPASKMSYENTKKMLRAVVGRNAAAHK